MKNTKMLILSMISLLSTVSGLQAGLSMRGTVYPIPGVGPEHLAQEDVSTDASFEQLSAENILELSKLFELFSQCDCMSEIEGIIEENNLRTRPDHNEKKTHIMRSLFLKMKDNNGKTISEIVQEKIDQDPKNDTTYCSRAKRNLEFVHERLKNGNPWQN